MQGNPTELSRLPLVLASPAVSSLQFIDVETASAARGPVLVVAGSLPSPWSEAAKGIFHVKRLPMQVVGYPRVDDALRTWTGAANVPVLINGAEPPRTGWAEILSFAERTGGEVSLVPTAAEQRIRHHGLAN